MVNLAKTTEVETMELSRTAYEAYSDSLGGKVPETESPLPAFDELSDKYKAAWKAVAHAVEGGLAQAPDSGGPPQAIA